MSFAHAQQAGEFVKLPDRVVMVDPTDRSIAEIIPLPASPTTGLGGDRR